MKPLVSIIVATYNQDESLMLALESLANQTYDNYEIILVDDNTDNEKKQKNKIIVDELRKKYPNIVLNYIVNSENKGSAKTRNIGIYASKGEYITFLDDDDVYLPKKIENQVNRMIDEKADYSITDLYLYNENQKLIDKRIRSYIKNNDPEFLLKCHMKYHMTGTDTIMFKKSYLLKIGCFDEIDLGDEFYLMKKAIIGNGRFCYAQGCDVKAYIHTGSNGLSSGENKIECENRLFEYKKMFFKRFDKKTCRYIKMRHYAVLAFLGVKMNKKLDILKNGIISFCYSPYECCKLILKRKI